MARVRVRGGAVVALRRCAVGAGRVGVRRAVVVGGVEEPTKATELVHKAGDVGVFGGI